MKQYENAYDCFEFLGPSPIIIKHAMANVFGKIYEFNLKDTIQRVRKIELFLI